MSEITSGLRATTEIEVSRSWAQVDRSRLSHALCLRTPHENSK